MTQVKLYASYSYVKDFQDGLSLIVLKDTPKVEGVKLLLNGNCNFSIDKSDFLAMLDSESIVFMEQLPKFVIKDMKNIFINNLQKTKSGL